MKIPKADENFITLGDQNAIVDEKKEKRVKSYGLGNKNEINNNTILYSA